MSVCDCKLFSYFSTKTYLVGTQKNHLNETVPLSTQKHTFTLIDKGNNNNFNQKQTMLDS